MSKQKTFWIAMAIGILFLFAFSLAEATQETLGTVKQGSTLTLMQTCGNCTYNNISYVVYPNKTIQLLNYAMTKNGVSYYYNTGSNFTQDYGKHDICGFGDPNNIIKTWCYDYEVTPNGETVSIGKALFYLGLLAVLIFFLVFTIYSFVTFNNLVSRASSLASSYFLIIAITFIGYNMAKDFLTSSPFIEDFLYLVWTILMYLALPFVIGLFVWWVVMFTKLKEINRYIAKGLSFEEAERRTGRKYK